MYVPPIVARKIEGQGIAPGEPFELFKTQVKNGRLRSIEWGIKRTHVQSPGDEVADMPFDAPSELESQLAQSIAAVTGENGNGDHVVQVQIGPRQNGSPGIAPAQTVPVTKLEHALKTAISAK